MRPLLELLRSAGFQHEDQKGVAAVLGTLNRDILQDIRSDLDSVIPSGCEHGISTARLVHGLPRQPDSRSSSRNALPLCQFREEGNPPFFR